MRIQIGTDVGGTFTDLWAVTDDGRSRVIKTPTTPDVVGGVAKAIELAAEALGLSIAELGAATRWFGHGTTAGLNALLTGEYPTTGLLTTAGFGDTLEIGRMKRQVAGLSDTEIGDYLERGRWKPVVPRSLVAEVRERVDREGRILQPLDEEQACEAIDVLVARGVRAIGVCTLWSTAEPAHERRLGELIRASAPELYVTLSHEVAPVVGEFARMSTTAVNAALGPVLAAYFERLDAALAELGIDVPASITTSEGGIGTSEEIVRRPVSALLSGPAAGVMRTRAMGQAMQRTNLLSIDVGGTSFDVGTIIDGRPLLATQTTIGGADVSSPSIDIDTVGAGGGSIAEVVHGTLRVGPRSAGAIPGPACYGRGGRLPTATDADLVLGVLAPGALSGGTLQLDPGAAERAIEEHVGEPLGLSVMQAAWGIRQVLDSRMADLLRTVTIERGHDPREFVLVANGGQGPAHAWALARELGISTVVVPPTGTVQSAVGTATTDPRRSVTRPVYLRLAPDVPVTDEQTTSLAEALRAARTAVVDQLRAELPGVEPQVTSEVSVRFRGQAHHLDVVVRRPVSDLASVGELLDQFMLEHETLFGKGSAFRAAGFEILSVRCTATSALDRLEEPRGNEPLRQAGERQVVFDDPDRAVSTQVYETTLPVGGTRIAGPALVVYPGQTAVVPPEAWGTTDEVGNLIIEIPPTAEGG